MAAVPQPNNMRGPNPENIIQGTSPIGGNGVEGTSNADAPIRDTEIQEIPLVYDPVTGDYVAAHRKVDKENEIITHQKSKAYEQEMVFLRTAGVKRSIEEE